MTETKNIHQILNEFDAKFGRKRLSVTVSHVHYDHILLKILYKKNTIQKKETNWPDRKFHEEDEITDQYAIAKLWFHNANEKFHNANKNTPEKEPEYQLTLWKDNLYVNQFTMPNHNLAKAFYKARSEWVSCKADLIIGSYNVTLGKTLTQQVKTICRKQLSDYAEDLENVAKNKPLSHFYEGSGRRWYIRTLRQSIDHLLRLHDWLEFDQAE